MPFDIGGAVNSLAAWLTSNQFVARAVSNPLIVSLIITTIAALYFYSIRGRPKLRPTLYMFGAVLAVMFLHHGIVTRVASNGAAQQHARDTIGGLRVNMPAARAAAVLSGMTDALEPPVVGGGGGLFDFPQVVISAARPA